MTNTVDPLGGSYHIESLTNQIEQGATEILARIDALGGTLAAIESGYIQRQIQDSAYQAQLAIDTGEAVVVGVNRYQTDEPDRIEVFSLDPALEQSQVERVQAAAGTARPGAVAGGARRRPPGGSGLRQSRPGRSSPPSKPTPRSARLLIRCARRSVSIAKWPWTES